MSKNKNIEILAKHAGIQIEDLEFKNEVQIIRPSEALEAMDEMALLFAQSMTNHEVTKSDLENFKKGE
jgi:hypothetical protein